MRVGGMDLFVWSFLMASAHGAGLMILPILMAQPMTGMEHDMGAVSAVLAPGATVVGWAVLIHTVSMLAVAGVLALLIFETYEISGLRILRHAWLNFDLLWAIALLVAGFAVVFF